MFSVRPSPRLWLHPPRSKLLFSDGSSGNTLPSSSINQSLFVEPKLYTLCNTLILTFLVQVEENLKKKKKKGSDGQCTEQWILLMPQESVSPESCVSWWVQRLVRAGKHPSPLLSQGTSVGTARRPDGRTFTQTSPASAAWTPATRRYVPQLLQLYAAALLPPLCWDHPTLPTDLQGETVVFYFEGFSLVIRRSKAFWPRCPIIAALVHFYRCGSH